MQLLDPDILADAKGLSPALSVTGLIAGLALWLLGWRSHRFWTVFSITVIGGIFGLAQGPTLRAQPLVVAVLLAIAGGMMALSLVRLVAFGTAGMTFLAAAQSIGPPGDGAMIFFLAGGLMGLLLFRLWVMILTSLGGALLIGYSGLCLADRLGKMNAPEWAANHTRLLNWACGAVAVVGVGLQLYLNRHKGDGKGSAKPARKAPPPPPPEESPAAGGPFSWVGGFFRKAA
jgi:hypothetical protein